MKAEISRPSPYCFWGCGLAAICLAAVLSLPACVNKANPNPGKMEGGGIPVMVAKVTRKDVPINIEVVGSVEASLTVTIRPQVNGELTVVHFREGDFVKKGDPLFETDRRVLEAQLNQIQSNLSKDEAQLILVRANLTRDEAQLKYALEEADRYVRMLKKGLVSAEQAEQYKANADAVTAAVNADKAAIQSAEAAVNASKASVENARVLLGYTTIRSPLDGRTGNLRVHPGNVVTANTTDLITINQVEPVFVTFSISETQLSQVRKSLPVTATPRDSAAQSEKGELAFIDNTVDPATGTIRLKAAFQNQDRELWPGEFVRVRLRLDTRPNCLVVPSQAVQTGQDGLYVFVVKQDRTVEFRPVVTGARVEQEMVIEKGLSPDETVVTEGQLRLAPGSRVQIGGRGNSSRGAPGGR